MSWVVPAAGHCLRQATQAADDLWVKCYGRTGVLDTSSRSSILRTRTVGADIDTAIHGWLPLISRSTLGLIAEGLTLMLPAVIAMRPPWDHGMWCSLVNILGSEPSERQFESDHPDCRSPRTYTGRRRISQYLTGHHLRFNVNERGVLLLPRPAWTGPSSFMPACCNGSFLPW